MAENLIGTFDNVTKVKAGGGQRNSQPKSQASVSQIFPFLRGPAHEFIFLYSHRSHLQKEIGQFWSCVVTGRGGIFGCPQGSILEGLGNHSAAEDQIWVGAMQSKSPTCCPIFPVLLFCF